MAEQSTLKRPKRRQSAAERGHSRLGDSTRPIAIERRLTTNRRGSWVLLMVAVTVAVAFAASFFVTPLQNYFEQEQDLDQRSEQLAKLRDVNQDLQAEVDRLSTSAGVAEASREELGYQLPGEQRVTIIEEGVVPTELPAGWPYDLFSQIAATKRSR